MSPDAGPGREFEQDLDGGSVAPEEARNDDFDFDVVRRLELADFLLIAEAVLGIRAKKNARMSAMNFRIGWKTPPMA